ncbi:TonB-dependent receptor plug domain-containing protein [Novosphingobium album (ex Liu et al. 2023)]|uniref:TonB-dependent receptor n=1 Tax=Novosphingobium album (ex Liu et al. 2023) TaxID=3031130 RepID=A0ABT5WV79_9SPHN|nr:TonB-dependent receptor [Novosphingobium album (ex Liu et al. 2023)]MDE8653810.1 TonB-dependent receptor [Novosphingobium album (ex Liu et al. 2023)]
MVAAVLASSVTLSPTWAQEDRDDAASEDGEEIIVQATRSGRSLNDEPIRVEVLDREEIEEKLMMTPGNIAMLVSETPGIRTQITSPSLGAASIRMQGMKGRYTQLLADGLPLYGGQAPAIGLLQIPPTDLGQVEVIKGAASALYGPSALGGVINLVSRRPSAEPEADVVLNATSRSGRDATGYAAAPIGGDWSASMTGGYDRQGRQDLNGDGWADMPAYRRWTVRPRLFWKGSSGARLFLTAGAMTERREGGTLPGRSAPDGQPFSQMLDSQRFDSGLAAEIPLMSGTLNIRASAMTQDDDHRSGDTIEDNRRRTVFGEASLSARSGRTSWLAGIAFQADIFRSADFPGFNYSYTVPALFAQIEHDMLDDLTLAGSARWDAHSEYGSQISPRLSLLYKPGRWTLRASLGRGFYAPTPFVEEIEEAGLSRLEPLDRLKAETANTASVDIGYKAGPLEADVTLFGSNIKDAVRLEADGPDRVKLANVAGLTRTRGAELLLRYRWEAFSITGSYVYVDATEQDPSGIGRRTVPLTPRHTGGLVGMWEKEGRGRVGLEAYYTGRQLLEDNPYRSRSSPYFELGAMGEFVIGKVSLFVNAENLLDIRQTKHDPLLLPRRAPDGAWTVDAWAPLEGRVVNGGVRIRFGGHE